MFQGAATVVLAFAACASALAGSSAEAILKSSGVQGGLVAHVGCGDGQLTAALAANDRYLVQGLDTDPANVAAARKHIQALGRYGQVSVRPWAGNRLPYADNLVNLLVADALADVPKAEVLRVLAPNGVALIAGQKIVKPWPADIDGWSHYQHGPDGNPVSNDRVVGPPKHYQWLAGPLWLRDHDTDSSISAVVTANGRIFYIVDEAPISLAGQHSLPDKWCLAARDGFNGLLLWKVPIRDWGWRQWKDTWFQNRPGDFPLNLQKRLVAAGDRVLVTLGYHAPVSELDAATGRVLRTYPGTEDAREILCDRGQMVVSVRRPAGLQVLALDIADGHVLWQSAATYRGSAQDYIKFIKTAENAVPPIEGSLNLAMDGAVVAFLDGKDVVALDRTTGKQRWRSEVAAASADAWIGTVIVGDGVVLHAEPQRLIALDADTGRRLWDRPKAPLGHLWYEWKEVFVIDGRVWTWSADTEKTEYVSQGQPTRTAPAPRSVCGYNLRTGALEKEVPLGNLFLANHHHRCYPNRATSRYILASRRGTEYVDLLQGQHTADNWVRGSCHFGMLPANGLQYAPPHPCVCYIQEKLNGFNALAPDSPTRSTPGDVPTQHRLERGPAYNAAGAADVTDGSVDDWPQYRHDAARSGATATKVTPQPAVLWKATLGGTLSPPVMAGGQIYLARVDQHQVLAVAAVDGRVRWSYTVGARVDTPPACCCGLVVFGARDGWVYCLRAADGVLVWRFQAAPEEVQIGAFEQLESAWPVYGSVLLKDDKAYFAAGRSSHLDGGIWLYGLDVRSGAVLCHAHLAGPEIDPQTMTINNNLPQGVVADILRESDHAIAMHGVRFDDRLVRQPGRAGGLEANGGFRDDTYFKRATWQDGPRRQFGRMFVDAGSMTFGLRMFDTLQCLSPTNYFTPGAAGYTYLALQAPGGKMAWSRKYPVRALALAATADTLFAAGPPDVVDPHDPLGAFEGRQGGVLLALAGTSGEKLGELRLDAPPVFDGMLAAANRLVIALADGTLLCLGEKP